MKGPKGNIKLPGDITNYDVVIPESVDKIADNLTDMEVFNEGIILHQVCLYLYYQVIVIIASRSSSDISVD